MEKKNIIEMESGKIYALDFGGNTQVVGRYKNGGICEYYFYTLLHYWNGYETFHENDTCGKSSVKGIRLASKAEAHHLCQAEIEKFYR